MQCFFTQNKLFSSLAHLYTGIWSILMKKLIELQCPIAIHFLMYKRWLYPFWTLGLPEVVLSNRPCPLVRPSICWFVRKYLRDCSLVFLIFCMKLGYRKGAKGTEPDFWKKILGGHKWGKTHIISLHLVIKSFWNFIYTISPTLSNT